MSVYEDEEHYHPDARHTAKTNTEFVRYLDVWCHSTLHTRPCTVHRYRTRISVSLVSCGPRRLDHKRAPAHGGSHQHHHSMFASKVVVSASQACPHTSYEAVHERSMLVLPLQLNHTFSVLAVWVIWNRPVEWIESNKVSSPWCSVVSGLEASV